MDVNGWLVLCIIVHLVKHVFVIIMTSAKVVQVLVLKVAHS